MSPFILSVPGACDYREPRKHFLNRFQLSLKVRIVKVVVIVIHMVCNE